MFLLFCRRDRRDPVRDRRDLEGGLVVDVIEELDGRRDPSRGEAAFTLRVSRSPGIKKEVSRGFVEGVRKSSLPVVKRPYIFIEKSVDLS